MTSVSQGARPARTPARRRRLQLLRRSITVETRLAVALAAVGLVLTLGVLVFPSQTPFTSLSLPLIVASIVLSPRTLPWFVIYQMVLLTVCVSAQHITSKTVGAIVIQFALGLIVLVLGLRRARLGVAGLRGESMFVDLRDRILSQGGIPALPEGWLVESALHSAEGTAFAGDFVVASTSPDRRQLRLVLVDVSGKGTEAGTRALLLSGAFGGLLDALPPEGFLPAANDYLLRQDWAEGFATAVHLVVDLDSGRYEARTAGHPPAVRRSAASGRWSVLGSSGPVLGLMADAEFSCVTGSLAGGDALVLYTDGMVESRHRDIDVGVDRMMGAADELIQHGFAGVAERLVRAVGSRNDDRAVLVVNRTG